MSFHGSQDTLWHHCKVPIPDLSEVDHDTETLTIPLNKEHCMKCD